MTQTLKKERKWNIGDICYLVGALKSKIIGFSETLYQIEVLESTEISIHKKGEISWWKNRFLWTHRRIGSKKYIKKNEWNIGDICFLAGASECKIMKFVGTEIEIEIINPSKRSIHNKGDIILMSRIFLHKENHNHTGRTQ